jgi:hypothetical protein
VIGVLPVQVPVVALSVWPFWGVPVTIGDEVSAGGTAWTGAVGEEVACWLPPALDAVTSTSSVPPTSAVTIVYVAEVAPVMLAQFAPFESQRFHW